MLFGQKISTSFHTYNIALTSLEVWALVWNVTNMCDGGRITTRVRYRSRCMLTLVIGWVGEPDLSGIQLSIIPRNQFSLSFINLNYYGQRWVSCSKSQPGDGIYCYTFYFHNHWEKVAAGVMCSGGRSIAGKLWFIIRNSSCTPCCILGLYIRSRCSYPGNAIYILQHFNIHLTAGIPRCLTLTVASVCHVRLKQELRIHQILIQMLILQSFFLFPKLIFHICYQLNLFILFLGILSLINTHLPLK